MGIVEQGTLLQAPLLLLAAGPGVEIGMQLAAQVVKVFLQSGDIEIQFAGQAEEGEVVHRSRRLNLAAGLGEVNGTHGAARPAGLSFLRCRLRGNRGQRRHSFRKTTARATVEAWTLAWW